MVAGREVFQSPHFPFSSDMPSITVQGSHEQKYVRGFIDFSLGPSQTFIVILFSADSPRGLLPEDFLLFI